MNTKEKAAPTSAERSIEMTKFSKALTWDELATLYDSCHSGRPARTLPMDKVFEWAEGQKDKFRVVKEGTIHRIESQPTP